MRLEFSVPGTPGSKLRHRTFVTSSGKQVQYTPQETRMYENMVTMIATDAANKANLSSRFMGPISVEVVAWFPVARTRSKKLLEGQPHLQRPDADNVLKAVVDGCARLWADDCSVYRKQITKRWTHLQPRAEVVIEVLEEI